MDDSFQRQTEIESGLAPDLTPWWWKGLCQWMIDFSTNRYEQGEDESSDRSAAQERERGER